ncbi:hypothetical protein PR048_003277 [Dryococelus australis]|uniref:Reverse transcriptase Ty1/copia-type domain-containing protein n=1 Tax=Dryococelus australis TaxID=614101 RepID=A0ABQ9IMI5_9NEOP|nr:hypothetical protein PR048_003277 [Dryococelus australis]
MVEEEQISREDSENDEDFYGFDNEAAVRMTSNRTKIHLIHLTYEVYAPVAELSTIRLALSCALQKNWDTKQVDVPTAFLNGTLDKDGVKGESVLKIQQPLYGLRESPRCWNQRFNLFAEECGLRRSRYNVCLYAGNSVWLVIWVDDILMFGEKQKVEEFAHKH